MFCRKCGSEAADGSTFCGSCGAPMTPETPPAAPPAPQQAAPVQAAPPAYAPPAYAPPPGSPPGAPMPGAPAPKRKTGMVVAVVAVVLLLLCCCVPVAVAIFVPAVRNMLPFGDGSAITSTGTDTGGDTASSDAGDSADIAAAQQTVESFYAAINAADLESVKALVVPDLSADLDPGAFEGWESTSFEYTRGWIRDGRASILGRESIRQYGSGGDGGVRFTLDKVNGAWLIESWTGADRAQIEGTDTTGASSGVKAGLDDATARDIVTRLLEARRQGSANVVRQLTTGSFQTQYGDIWLDGSDNTEFFTGFSITNVTIGSGTATVTTSEEWNSGPEPATYTVVEQGGVLLVDTWN